MVIPKELESQPSKFSGHLLLPRQTALPFVEEEIRKLGDHASPRQMEAIVRKVMDTFQVSRQMATLRLKDFGYDVAKGVNRYVDGHYVPSYGTSNGEWKNGIDYIIEHKAVFELYFDDADASDGFAASADGAFAVAGVMKPYQLRDVELVPDDEIFGCYDILNGARTLVYTFVPEGEGDAFTVEKTAGVSRVDDPTGDLDPAIYEFYSVFPAGTLKPGERYDVSVQAFDGKGERIEGMDTRFGISG